MTRNKISLWNAFKRVFDDQRGFGLFEVAIPALVDAVSTISIADVGIGAALGGGLSAIEGGNVLEGALGGGLAGGLLPAFGPELGDSLGIGATGGEALLGAGLGGGESAIQGHNPLMGAVEGGVGGAVAANIGGSSASPTGAPVSSAPGSGGFESGTSLLSGQDQSTLAQLGNAVPSGGVPGSTTPNATNLGSLGNLGQTIPSSTPDIGGGDLEAGTGSNFSAGVLPDGGNTNLSSGLPVTPSSSPGAAPDSLGVPGGVATSNLTGGSNVTSSSTSSGDLGDQISGFLNNGSNLKYALPAGELINTLIQGPQKLPSNAQPLEQGGAVEGPLQATEAESLNAYNSQTLTPGQQAQIDQYTQAQTNQLYQQLASAGVTNPHEDSRFIQGMEQIQQQAEAMKQQLLGSDLSAGEGAAGQAATDLTATAQMQNKEDEDYQNAIEAAISSFGQMAGGSSLEKLLAGGS